MQIGLNKNTKKILPHSIFHVSYSLFKKFHSIFLIISFGTFYSIYCLYWTNASEGVLQPGDGINHYQIARYSWQNPSLLLHLWGKPLFTLLSSPFAQLGYIGMTLFNCILFGVTTFFLHKTARLFKFKFTWLIPVLLMSSPVYYKMVNAGMTEILFGALLTVTVWLFVKEKYTIGSIVASLILFSRPEGYLILPLFGLFLLMKKQWKYIPLLCFGYLFYSIIGYFYYDDILWLINKDPYPEKTLFYGHGELLFFVKNYSNIFGRVLVFSAIIWVVYVLYQLIILKQSKYFWFWSLLIIAPIVIVYAVHSYLWWKGLKGSLGLLRVISTVVPMIVLLSLSGGNLLYQILIKVHKKYMFWLISFVLLILATYKASKTVEVIKFPIKEDVVLTLITKSSNWYKKQNFEGSICYLDPYFAYKADINRFDEDKVTLLWLLDKNIPSKGLTKGDVIMWDAHFGPNEGSISKETLLSDTALTVIKHFEPKQKIQVLGGYDYEIYFCQVK